MLPVRVRRGGRRECSEYRHRRRDASTNRVQSRGLKLRWLTGDVLREVEDGDVGDDELFGHEKALSESDGGVGTERCAARAHKIG